MFSCPTPGITTAINANHSKKEKIKHLNIQLESILLRLLVSSFVHVYELGMSTTRLDRKRHSSAAAWTQRGLNLAGFLSPAQESRLGFSGEAAAPCRVSNPLVSSLRGGLEKWQSQYRRGRHYSAVMLAGIFLLKDLWTEEMILMLGSDPWKTLCRKEANWEPRIAGSSLEHPYWQMPTWGSQRLKGRECAVMGVLGPAASEAPSQQPSAAPPPPAAGSC